MMQLSTLSQHIRSKGWTKSIKDLHLNIILIKVERAGFLVKNDEQESGPFGLFTPIWSAGCWIKNVYARYSHCYPFSS